MRSLTVLLGVVLATWKADARCPLGYQESKCFTGCYRVYDHPMSRYMAERACSSMFGYLLTIDTYEEQSCLSKELNERNTEINGYWTAATNRGAWAWETNNVPVETELWANNEPLNGDFYQFAALMVQGSEMGKLSAAQANGSIGAICEREPWY